MYDSIECLLVTKVWYEPSIKTGTNTNNYYVVKVKGYETNGREVVRIINFAETYYRDGNNAICVGKALHFDMDFCGNNSFSWDDAYFYTPGIFRGPIYPPTPNCTFVITNNHLLTFDIYINGSFRGTIKGRSKEKIYAVGETPTTIKVVQKNYLLIPSVYKHTINQTKWGDVYTWTIPL